MLAPLLPAQPVRGGRWRDHRQVINAICWVKRTGSPWRDLPERYGPWQSVYTRFRRWTRAGVWDGIFAAVQQQADAAGEIDWSVSIDSTINRAHQHAATLPRHTRGTTELHETAVRAG